LPTARYERSKSFSQDFHSTMGSASILLTSFIASLTICSVVYANNSTSCVSGMTSSEALQYSQELIDKCKSSVGASEQEVDAVRMCMDAILETTSVAFQALSCPLAEYVDTMLAGPLGACGNIHKQKDTSMRNILGHEKEQQQRITRIGTSTFTDVAARQEGSHHSVSRDVNEELSLQGTVSNRKRRCCCDYCYNFWSNDRAFCFLRCCGNYLCCCW
jgi:hypothetical protein